MKYVIGWMGFTDRYPVNVSRGLFRLLIFCEFVAFFLSPGSLFGCFSFFLTPSPSLASLDLTCNINDAFQFFPHFAMYFEWVVYDSMMDAVLNQWD